jgi:hypothetical protein
MYRILAPDALPEVFDHLDEAEAFALSEVEVPWTISADGCYDRRSVESPDWNEVD